MALTQTHAGYSCRCSQTAFKFPTDTTKFSTKSFYTLTCPKTNEDDNAPCTVSAVQDISGVWPLDWPVARFVAPSVSAFVMKRAVRGETLVCSIQHKAVE